MVSTFLFARGPLVAEESYAKVHSYTCWGGSALGQIGEEGPYPGDGNIPLSSVENQGWIFQKNTGNQVPWQTVSTLYTGTFNLCETVMK